MASARLHRSSANVCLVLEGTSNGIGRRLAVCDAGGDWPPIAVRTAALAVALAWVLWKAMNKMILDAVCLTNNSPAPDQTRLSVGVPCLPLGASMSTAPELGVFLQSKLLFSILYPPSSPCILPRCAAALWSKINENVSDFFLLRKRERRRRRENIYTIMIAQMEPS